MKRSTKIGAALLGAALVISPIAMTASPASAAVSTKVVPYTSAQLKEFGFPKKPDLTNWAPGTASVSPRIAAAGDTVTITGKAPKSVKPGTVLSLKRFLPSDKKGSGDMQDLGITDAVDKNGNYTIVAQLGRVGTWGYSVGYMTDPPGNVGGEFIGYQFQLTTTAS